MPTRMHLPIPAGTEKVLLHSCCAPCSGEVMEAMQASGLDLTIYFYNPNIHPREEYDLRKVENIRFAEKMNIPFVDADYDSDNWFTRVKGLEWEPERGARCTQCFDMRFKRTKMDLTCLRHASASRAGKIWSRSTIAAIVPPAVMRACVIGIIIGV